jgi:hypothetical protein
MVQAIENWADLSGGVREVRPRPGVPQMSELAIEVERVDDVEGFPNAFADAPGGELTVAIETERIEQAGVHPGDSVRVRAQRTSPSLAVAHPDGLAKTEP